MSLPHTNSTTVPIDIMPPTTSNANANANANITQTVDNNDNGTTPGANVPHLSPASSNASTLSSETDILISPNFESTSQDYQCNVNVNEDQGEIDTESTAAADSSSSYEGSASGDDDDLDMFVGQGQGFTTQNFVLGIHETVDQRALGIGHPGRRFPVSRFINAHGYAYHFRHTPSPHATRPRPSTMMLFDHEGPRDMSIFVTGQSTAMVRSTATYDSDNLHRSKRYRPTPREQWSPAVTNRLAFMEALYWLQKSMAHDGVLQDEYDFRRKSVPWISSEGLLMAFLDGRRTISVPADYVFLWETPEGLQSERAYGSLPQVIRDAQARGQVDLWMSERQSRASRAPQQGH